MAKTKKTYSIADCIRFPWFPVRHPLTIRRHIESGTFVAHKFRGRTPDGNRYEIPRESIVAFCKLFGVTPPASF